MTWTLFVLNFDGTYDNEDCDEIGVPPLVYAIPLDKVEDVKECAEQAHSDFHTDEACCQCIGDYFEDRLTENNIDYVEVGEIKLTHGERGYNFLADYIPRAIV